ncbi:MAG TPA: glycosyltransferase family 39 protein [Gemmatimonadaceae bacterium]|jgi:4-amino-4-deoxy-L-arabinose transferase-like glycosyltransferase
MTPPTARRAIVAISIVLLALLLRFGHLQHRALDNDEIAEVRWSSLPFPEMMAAVKADVVHPPGDYIVQFVVGRRGSEWVRRLPSVIAGATSVGLMILLGTWWISWRTGAFAGLLLAVSPIHVFYSQQVRPYSCALFYTLSSLVALELYAKTRKRYWAAAWFVLVFLAGGTLYFAGMIAALAGIIRIFLDRKDRLRPLWRRVPLIVVAWAALYSPWFSVIWTAVKRPSPNPPAQLDWAWWTWHLQSLAAGSDRTWEPVSLASWAFWFIVAAGALISIRVRLLRVPAFMLLAGTAMEIALLHMHPHYPAVRYFMPSWIGAFVLAGAALGLFSRYWASASLAVAITLLFVGCAGIKIDEYYRGDRSDWREVAIYVHERIQPRDTLVVANPWVSRNFGYYWQQLPKVRDLTIVRYSANGEELIGPSWIVTGGCLPRQAIQVAPLMKQFPRTELAEVRFLRAGMRMRATEELCPE